MKSQNTDQNIMNINAKVCVTACKVGNIHKYIKTHVWHRVGAVCFQLVFKISCEESTNDEMQNNTCQNIMK